VRLLLDTHILLWALAEDYKLSTAQREAIESAELFVSSVSIWEIGIKRALGKLEVPPGIAAQARASGCNELAVNWKHADLAADLPRHHSDPFDRMLIAQSMSEGMVLCSADAKLKAYGVRVID